MKFYIICLIFIISFFKGSLQLYGLSSMTSQLIIEGLIIVLFIYALGKVINKKKIIAPALIFFLLFIFVSIISFLTSKVKLLEFFVFARNIFIYYLFFYALFNINLNQKQKSKILSLLVFLCLIQIPSTIWKILTMGTSEMYIGTMSIGEGSLATIMPLFPISYLLSKYLGRKSVKYMVLIVLFIGIGLASNKLGILVYVVLLFLLLTYFYSNPKFVLPNIVFLRKTSRILVYLIIIFVLFAKLNPRSNPENKVWGTFDIYYLIDYSNRYQSLDMGNGVEGDGRFEAPFVAMDRLNDEGFKSLLFGFGPGDLVKSTFSKSKDPLLEKYNIGYGGRLGFVWVLLQTGFLGTFLFILFHLVFFIRLYKIYSKNGKSKNEDFLILTAIGFSLIFFFDFFTYSSQMILNPVVALMYYFSIYYVITIKDEESPLNLTII